MNIDLFTPGLVLGRIPLLPEGQVGLTHSEVRGGFLEEVAQVLLKDWEKLSGKMAAGVGRMRVPGNSVPCGLQELLAGFRCVPHFCHHGGRGVGEASHVADWGRLGSDVTQPLYTDRSRQEV